MSTRSVAVLAAALLCLPASLAAQSGTIRYERSLTRTRDALFAELPGGARPGARGGDAAAGRARAGRVPPGGDAAARGGAGFGRGEGAELQEYATLTLTFDGTAALTQIQPAVPAEGDRGPAGRPGGAAGAGGRAGDGAGAQRLQQGFGARGVPGLPTRRTTAVWVDAATGEMVETVDFMTREFRVVGETEPLPWRLLGEESDYLGYVVQKAVAERDSSTIEAWFTVDIPGFAAPEGYTGLPGVVLMVSVDRGKTLIQAVGVDLDTPVEAVTKPTDGDEMTADEFEALVAEKTDEFRAELQSRRRGGGGGA